MHFIKKYKYIITTIIIIILLLTYLLIKKELNKKEYIVSSNEEIEEKEEPAQLESSEEIKISYCTVDIKGSVNKPGVYVTECTKHVYDIIELAGGLTELADTSKVNLAKQIVDEMVIIIDNVDEVKDNNNFEIDNNAKITQDNKTNNKLININTASIEELKSLTGIGESKAKAIIKYREEFGYFKNIADIQNVSGIGANIYEKIKDNITT